jgi:small subunit ribosomal protein S6
MNKYEVLYILEGSLEDAAREAEIEKFSAAVTENGGEVESVNKWGMRKFAYEINYKTEGYYVLMTFTAKPEFPAELERRMRITDAVVRFKVARK